MRFLPLLILALCGAGASRGTPDESWRYLGRTPPGEERAVFLPGIAERIAISDDGREIYFNDSARGISVHRYADGRWEEPASVFAQCGAAALSPDGRTITVQNALGNILAADRAGAGWTVPRVWLNPPERLHYFQQTSGGAGYATRMGASPRGIQGTICAVSGTGTAVQLDPLPPSINSGDNGVDFFVARDDSFIIFVVHPGGANGDLNIAFRKPDGTWSRPLNLGPQVNRDTTWEWGPFVSPDGRFLFYTAASSAKDVAVYWIRIDGILERLRRAALAP